MLCIPIPVGGLTEQSETEVPSPTTCSTHIILHSCVINISVHAVWGDLIDVSGWDVFICFLQNVFRLLFLIHQTDKGAFITVFLFFKDLIASRHFYVFLQLTIIIKVLLWYAIQNGFPEKELNSKGVD